MIDLIPDFQSFEERHERGEAQVLWAQLPADLDTPVSLMLKLAQAGPESFLFESVTGGAQRGRYSIIGWKPDLIWRAKGDQAEINRHAGYDRHAFETVEGAGALESLRALIAESRIELPEDLPAASAGLFGYLGYDMARLAERLPEPNSDPLGLPDSIFIRPAVVAVIDNVYDRLTLVAPVWGQSGVSAREAYNRAAERLADAHRDLDRPLPLAERLDLEIDSDITPISNTTEQRYLQMVETAKEYIAAGDIFQVVPSQRWRFPFRLPAFSLYRALRRTNPSPYMFFFNFSACEAPFQITGASPEILVRVVKDAKLGRKVTIRPIAGTRPRGDSTARDIALENELLADPKERAEHLMLLDLGRNDVGRVAKIGTVTPTHQFEIERYSHVMHIVSNVEGALRDDHDALSALLAGLPAGTVSGAPKIRAMEIIDELEDEKRGVYAGAIGYFSAGGDMDTCIALRTAVIKDEQVYVQAGGGVVADSDPRAEWRETVNKSQALIRAAAEASRYAMRGNR